MKNRRFAALVTIPCVLWGQGCSSGEKGEDLLDLKKQTIVGGQVAGGDVGAAKNLVDNGIIVKIDIPGRVCSGIMLAGGWIFTAKHCLVTNATPPQKIKGSFFRINGKPTEGTVFLAESNDPTAPKSPGSKDIWAAYIHPNRDLALVHSILPGTHEPDGKMILEQGPIFNPNSIKLGQNVAPIYGFGCTGNSTSDYPSFPRETSMVAAGSLQQLANDGYKTWGIRLNKKNNSSGVTASGDSGGPGFINIKTKVKGKEEFINALSTITHGGPKTATSCQFGDYGFFTTFDGKAGYEPFVEQWIGEIQAKPLPQPPPAPTPPPNPNPKQSNINVPGIPFPVPGFGDQYFPTVAWADLDNDGLWDMYSWGEAGLQAAKQVVEGLQPPVSLASSFQVVEDNKPFFANFDGEGADDLFALSSSAGQFFLQILPGHSGGSFANADFFDPPQAPFALPAIDLPLSPRTASLRNDSAGRRALLLATTGSKSQTAFTNVLFAELSDVQIPGLPKTPAVPIPLAIPNLVTGAATNYIVADADSDGLDELIVLAEGESEFSANVSVYYPLTQNGFTYVQLYDIPGIPTNCPVPRNSVFFKDINQDGINDFVCVRPGTIEVRMGVKSSSGTFDGVFEEAIQSDFSWFQSSDPSAATDDGTETGNPVYPWPIYAYLTDLNGDNRPDFVGTSFLGQVWTRMNLGQGKFGTEELLRMDSIYYALGFDILEPKPGKAATLAFSNAYPSGSLDPSQGAQSVTLLRYAERSLDGDGDGISDVLDNCPYKANPTQTDLDGDGIGDLCDTTNCGPDSDLDGVPDEIPAALAVSGGICATAATDNCPKTANSGQENCNKAAEDANNALSLGDACDPVPCPQIDAVVKTTIDEVILPKYTYIFSPSGKKVDVGPIILHLGVSDIDVRTVPRHRRFPSDDGVDIETSTTGIRTNYRFCPGLPGADNVPGSSCVALDALKSSFFSQSSTFRAAEPKPLQQPAWLRVNVIPFGPDKGDESNSATNYAGQSFSRTWQTTADLGFWSSKYGSSFAPAKYNPGYLGAHFEGFSNDTSWGIHPSKNDSELAVAPADLAIGLAATTLLKESISGAFFKPEDVNEFLCSGASCSEALGGLLWLPDDSSPSDLHPRCASQTSCAFTKPGGFLPLWRVPGHPEEVSLLENNGLLIRVGEELSSSIRALLTDGSLVLSPAEPSSQVANASRNPIAVAISADGTRVQSHLKWSESGLEAAPPAGCGLRGCGGFLAARRSEPERKGFVTVYARSVGVVFAGGGSAEGQPFNGLVRQDIHTANGWQTVEVQPEGGFGKIESLGWSYLEQKLWVLDEADGKIRLWKLAPEGGKADLLGTWKKNKKVDAYWLVPDLDGNMLLVSSSQKVHKHRIVAINARGEAIVQNFYRGQGALFSAPRVSSRGIDLVIHEGKKKMPSVKRLRDPEKKLLSWVDVEDCF